MTEIRHQAFILVGPTAVGKSAVAHALARELHAGILSADSMLVYRGMDIGTAKPGAAERAEVPYWGLDLAEPTEAFSAGRYLEAVRTAPAEAAQQGRGLIVAGGTGLYVRCLLQGLRPAPPPDAAVRSRYEAILARDGVKGLQAELSRVDAARLQRLADPENPRRLIRALEQAGRPDPGPTWSRAELPLLIGLRRTASDLADRIVRRVEQMYADGLIEEARALRERHTPLSDTARQAIGYEEAWAVLDGRCTTAEAKAATCARTRQLAKRQMTWFRHQANMRWMDVHRDMHATELAAMVRSEWTNHGPTPLAL